MRMAYLYEMFAIASTDVSVVMLTNDINNRTFSLERWEKGKAKLIEIIERFPKQL